MWKREILWVLLWTQGRRWNAISRICGFNKSTIHYWVVTHIINAIILSRNWTVKRVTMLSRICADWLTLIQLIVLFWDTIGQELLNNEYTQNIVMFWKSDSDFINSDLLIRLAKESFTPKMREKRISHAYYKPILLLIDGFGIHDSDEFHINLKDEKIHLILFVLH